MPETAAVQGEVATVAETENVATEAENQPDPAQEATDGAGETADPAEQESKERPETVDEEIKRLRRENRKRERTQQKLYGENEVLKAQLARFNASPQQGEQHPTGNTNVGPDPADVARTIVAVERFNDRCNTIAEQGKKAFGKEFMPAWGAIANEIPIVDQTTGKATPFFESITDLDDPAAVIRHIGTNPDLIDELADLSGRKLDRKLALIEAELKAKPKFSTAPTPITPLKPRGAAGEPDPKNTRAWNDWYEKSRAASR